MRSCDIWVRWIIHTLSSRTRIIACKLNNSANSFASPTLMHGSSCWCWCVFDFKWPGENRVSLLCRAFIFKSNLVSHHPISSSLSPPSHYSFNRAARNSQQIFSEFSSKREKERRERADLIHPRRVDGGFTSFYWEREKGKNVSDRIDLLRLSLSLDWLCRKWG